VFESDNVVVETSATGGSASSQAATVGSRAWQARPLVSASIRLVVVVVPVGVAVAAVKAATLVVPRPVTRWALWGWMAALLVVSFAISVAVQRVMRRLLPLALLFKMSLVFPDEAPSRFKAAIRRGTSRSLADRLHDPESTSSPEQAAAEELLALLARLTDHDRLTRGHTERVRAYSMMLGEQIGLSGDDLEKLNWAALIHDIGKLDVPEPLLNKTGQPTAGEWAVLRTHPAAASVHVEPLRSWLGEWVDAATQHHERFDGNGYPLGLCGKSISLSGRIVSIADAYDVMTAARSYKKPLPAAQARAELLRNAGTQFDPQLVRSFLEISLGRTRRIIGPLGWLTQLPDIVRTPLTAVATSTSGVVTATAIGLAAAAGATTAPLEPQHPAVASAYVNQFDDFVLGSTAPVDSATTATSSTTDAATSTTANAATNITASTTTTDAAITTTSVNPTGPAIAGPTPAATSQPPTTTAITATPTTATPTATPSTPASTAPSATAPPTTAPPTTIAPTTVAPTTVAAGRMLAVADLALTTSGKSVSIHVLQNDDFGSSSANLSSLTVVTGPAHGSVTVTGQNLLYIPAAGYLGTDSMSYSICSQSGSCDQATVLVTITP
jgi:hypothetical protein